MFLNPFNPRQRPPFIVLFSFAALQHGSQCVLLISSEPCRCGSVSLRTQPRNLPGRMWGAAWPPLPHPEPEPPAPSAVVSRPTYLQENTTFISLCHTRHLPLPTVGAQYSWCKPLHSKWHLSEVRPREASNLEQTGKEIVLWEWVSPRSYFLFPFLGLYGRVEGRPHCLRTQCWYLLLLTKESPVCPGECDKG